MDCKSIAFGLRGFESLPAHLREQIAGEVCFRTLREDSNAGAMIRHQSDPRGGVQPEASGNESRGADESLPAHQN